MTSGDICTQGPDHTETDQSPAAPPVAAPASAPPVAPAGLGQPHGQPATGVPYPAMGVPYQATGMLYPVTGAPSGPGAVFHRYAAPGWTPQPPPRRNTALRWIVGTVAILVVCSMVGLGGLVGYAQYTGALDTHAAWQPARAPVDAPPAQNAPASEWSSWARRSIDDALDSQAKALLAADEDGYLAAVDPANARLLADQKRRFKVLTAMGPGVWNQAVTGGVRSSGTRSWDAKVRISYCFGEPTCEAVQISVATKWRFTDHHLVIVRVDHSSSAANGPRPWETEELSVARGRRVVMAASKVNAWRLKEAVTYADRAAAVADTFAKWDDPPSRFVIFLAGPNDWTEWYGHEQPEWAAAWAVPVSRTVTEVVVRTAVVRQSELQTLLTHELIHVTTLAGDRDGADRTAWWLIEGIAEYGSLSKQPVREYDALSPTRSFVRGAWDGDPAVNPPTSATSLNEAAARYGVSYLAVRRIAEKYGKAKTLDFFGLVVHDGETVQAAAPVALGVSWSTVKGDTARFIRNAVG